MKSLKRINIFDGGPLFLESEIFFAQDLKSVDVFVYAFIRDLTEKNKENKCEANNSYLANLVNKKIKTVQNSLKRLKTLNLIEMTYFEEEKKTRRIIYIKPENMSKLKLRVSKEFLDEFYNRSSNQK